ncbi:ribonuclease R [Spirochaetota bacterium]|nr:ribonuclease R [Spirochaetota bacterium]
MKKRYSHARRHIKGRTRSRSEKRRSSYKHVSAKAGRDYSNKKPQAFARRSPFKYTALAERDFETLCKRYSYATRFTPAVLNEAKELSDHYLASEETFIAEREDLRNNLIFTIDGEDARDHDDAISLTVTKNTDNLPVYTLGVHIADVSCFVTDGSKIDNAACQRGTSVYVPGQTLPMLPEILSNGVCSLTENAVRLTVSGEFVLDHTGTVKKARFFRSVIKSRHKLTYPIVQAVLDEKLFLGGELDYTLKKMQTLSEILLAKRLKEGAIDLNLLEQKIILENDTVREILLKERTASERLIEEFMLVMNREVAVVLAKYELGIFRSHGAPDPLRIAKLNELLIKLGTPVSTEGSEDPLKMKIKVYNRLYLTLAQIKNNARHQTAAYWTLLAMNQAEYSDLNKGHYALGFSNYAHFTSPIRRYPDLLAHRLLLSYSKDQSVSVAESLKIYSAPPITKSDLKYRIERSNINERKAIACEREYILVKTIRYLSDQTRHDPMPAYITKFHPRGHVYACNKTTGIEGIIHKSYFYGKFVLDHNRERLRRIDGKEGGYGLGSSIFVKLERVDLIRLKIYLALVTDVGENNSSAA